MSLTFLAKSSAYSWKMSFCGQVLCQRIEIGPWALTTIGKPSVAAPAAAAVFKNRRRGASGVACRVLMRRLLSRCSCGVVEEPPDSLGPTGLVVSPAALRRIL